MRQIAWSAFAFAAFACSAEPIGNPGTPTSDLGGQEMMPGTAMDVNSPEFKAKAEQMARDGHVDPKSDIYKALRDKAYQEHASQWSPRQKAIVDASLAAEKRPKPLHTGLFHGKQVAYEAVGDLAMIGDDVVIGKVDADGKLLEPQGKVLQQPSGYAVSFGVDRGDGWMYDPAWKWPERFDYDRMRWLGGCEIQWTYDPMPAEHYYAAIDAMNEVESATRCHFEYVPPDYPGYKLHWYNRLNPNNPKSLGVSNFGRNCAKTAGGEEYCWPSELSGLVETAIYLNLGDKATAQHELMHALGFYHEEERPDRDDHCDINPNYEGQYDKFDFDWWHIARVGYYDDRSIIHDNGWCEWTMVQPFPWMCGIWVCWGVALPKGYVGKFECWPGGAGVSIGQGQYLTQGDVDSINAVYPPKW